VPDERVASVIVANLFQEVVWKIEAQRNVGANASAVTYGVIPTGFVQTIPKLGTAPRLEKNEDYYVRVEGQGWGAASFVYHGAGTHSVRN
jgi:hypothetical protein